MKLLHHFYYELKPFLPKRLRMLFRRHAAKRAYAANRKRWPIDAACEGKPLGWNGWPGGKQFAVVLTHDVEGQIGYTRIPDLLHLEVDAGFRSSFNLIPEGEYKVEQKVRSFISQEGFEVGVHDLRHDGKLYRSRTGFAKAARRINSYLSEWNACGFRSAFMHHNLDWLRDLKIRYDLSTFDFDPFEPQPDGVNTVFPFFVYSPEGRKSYLEMPYTLVQDSTLFLLLRRGSVDIWKRKIDWLAQLGGMVLLNVHPDYTNFDQRQNYREFPARFYAELLTYLVEAYSGAFWHGLPRELCEEIELASTKPARANNQEGAE